MLGLWEIQGLRTIGYFSQTTPEPCKGMRIPARRDTIHLKGG